MKSIEEIASSLRSQGIDVEPVRFSPGYDLVTLEEHVKEVYRGSEVNPIFFFEENQKSSSGHNSIPYIAITERLKQLTNLEEN